MDVSALALRMASQTWGPGYRNEFLWNEVFSHRNVLLSVSCGYKTQGSILHQALCTSSGLSSNSWGPSPVRLEGPGSVCWSLWVSGSVSPRRSYSRHTANPSPASSSQGPAFGLLPPASAVFCPPPGLPVLGCPSGPFTT